MKASNKHISKETILSGYDDDNIIEWISGLKYFSFYKGFLNPYLTDGDGFDCDLKYIDREDLLSTLRILGVRFRVLKDSEPRIVKGEPYPKDIFNRLPKTTSEFNDIEEISKNWINGTPCSISIPNKYIHITLRRKQHEKENWLTDKELFEKAITIEEYIFKSGLENRVTKEFQDYIGYVDRQKLKQII
jgi:hypothetical protein